MILLPGAYEHGSSSISRQALRGAVSDSPSSASDGMTNSVSLSPQAVAALVAACFVGAMLFGIAVDAVVKHINHPIASDATPEQTSAERDSRVRNAQASSTSMHFARDGVGPTEGLERGLSNCLEHSGDWSRRGVSITNGASSIGMSMYADIEDGCVDYRQHQLRHIDLSDPTKEPS